MGWYLLLVPRELFAVLASGTTLGPEDRSGSPKLGSLNWCYLLADKWKAGCSLAPSKRNLLFEQLISAKLINFWILEFWGKTEGKFHSQEFTTNWFFERLFSQISAQYKHW